LEEYKKEVAMLNFDFTEEQEKMRKNVRKFWAEEVPNEYGRHIDETKEFPADLWQKIADQGWLGFPFPKEYGGGGGTIVDQALLLNEISRGLFVAGFRYLLTTCFGGNTINVFGTHEQKKRYLTKIASGEYKWSLALTEPGGGTDILGSTITNARLDGDSWVVNGQKTFISGATESAYFTLFARTNDNPAIKNKAFTLFVIDAKSPGISITKIHKLGVRACPTCDVFFDNVRIPKENVIGKVDDGWYHLVDTLNNERITVAAFCVGLADAALEEMIDYAKKRVAFGRPISTFQSLQNQITDVYVKLEQAKLILYRAAWLQSQRKPVFEAGTMAKLVCSEVAHQASVVGMRVLAGAGYTKNFSMERHYRDAILFLCAPISNESAKNQLAISLGLGKSF